MQYSLLDGGGNRNKWLTMKNNVYVLCLCKIMWITHQIMAKIVQNLQIRKMPLHLGSRLIAAHFVNANSEEGTEHLLAPTIGYI